MNNISFVVNTDVNQSANGIGKTTNPFQVIVVPALLIFYVLLFGYRISNFYSDLYFRVALYDVPFFGGAEYFANTYQFIFADWVQGFVKLFG